ncbi:hypothetical protein [Amycolatopsis sp. cg9]|uniref:hypothetical protein n=1 Tax=Amycolatopsis sp. cg9 TaxID=3238801 RepID=UPI0035236DCE
MKWLLVFIGGVWFLGVVIIMGALGGGIVTHWPGVAGDEVVTSFAASASSALFLLAIAVVTYPTFRGNQRAAVHQVTYGDKIDEVKSHLTRTRDLLSELEDDLTTRTALLEKTQEDAERYEHLASLNAEQAKAIDDLVGRQFKRQGRADAIYWWAALVIAFLSGIVVNAITPTVLSWFS